MNSVILLLQLGSVNKNLNKTQATRTIKLINSPLCGAGYHGFCIDSLHVEQQLAQ